jgi:pimeloyl-ACP methyl ester carboxylesterase
MPHARINGADLFYEEAGAGEPIIFHHGYTGSHDSWPGVVARLKDRYHCIMMDARGAGDSSHPADGYTMAQYALDIVGMADHLGLRRFTYVGHSMGGVIGMQLGLEHADRLDRLVLVAPAPADGIADSPEMRAMHARGREMWAMKDRDTMIRERTITTARVNTATQVANGVDRALSVSAGHYDQSWQELVDFRGGDRLGEITTPTLMIAGAADSLLPANLKDFLRLPNATLHVFSRVSHGIPLETTEEFATVLADFLEHGVVTAATLQAKLREPAATR